MITCKCGKAMERIPSWLATVNAEFVCNNCPQRQTKNIAFISLDPNLPPASKAGKDLDVEEVADDEKEEEED